MRASAHAYLGYCVYLRIKQADKRKPSEHPRTGSYSKW